jgi:hypothetical protein
MQDGSANKNSGWRQQLDNQKPVSFNKEAAWEKLKLRLGNKQPKRRVLYLRWAAAFILLLAGLYFLLPGKTKPAGETVVLKKSTPEPAQQNKKTQDEPDQHVAAGTTTGKQRLPANEKAEAGKRKQVAGIPVSANKENPGQQTATVVIEAVQAENRNPPAAKKETAVVAETIVQTKPRLKVVHINELGSQQPFTQPVPAAQAAAKRSALPGFRKPVYVQEETNREESLSGPAPRKRILSIGSIISAKDQ